MFWAMLYYIFHIIFHILIFVFLRYRVRGAENFPKSGPFIVASNHLSYLDPILIGCATWQKIHFIAKEDLLKSGFFGKLLKRLGSFAVNRDRFDKGAIKEALQRLKGGKVLAIFPEGTRSESADIIREPRAGVGFLAMKADVPVVPVRIFGSDQVLPKYARFIRFKPVLVKVGKPVYPADVLGPLSKKNNAFLDKRYIYRQMSKEVMKRISNL